MTGYGSGRRRPFGQSILSQWLFPPAPSVGLRHYASAPVRKPPQRPVIRPRRAIPEQRELVARERHALIRGLIHSDGCRTVANDRGVRSVRYHFSNKSEDIKDIYCESLDALGIQWTKPSQREVAVYRKASTALLDEFVGPKR